jgi:hypothetical protein
VKDVTKCCKVDLYAHKKDESGRVKGIVSEAELDESPLFRGALQPSRHSDLRLALGTLSFSIVMVTIDSSVHTEKMEREGEREGKKVSNWTVKGVG